MIVSLTTTPMMCALFLKHESAESHGELYKKSERAFQWISTSTPPGCATSSTPGQDHAGPDSTVTSMFSCS